MSYEDFIKAVEIFGIISTMSKKDIKKIFKAFKKISSRCWGWKQWEVYGAKKSLWYFARVYGKL